MNANRMPRGLSLVEVSAMIFVVAVALVMLARNTMSSMSSARDAADCAAAVRAARLKLEEVAVAPFDKLPTYANLEFEVPLEYTASDRVLSLTGNTVLDRNRNLQSLKPDGTKAGEVIVITDGTAQASSFGRDFVNNTTRRLPKDGQPDGVSFRGLPMDLRAGGLTADPVVRYPVGVVITWWGACGRIERYELWTIVTRIR